MEFELIVEGVSRFSLFGDNPDDLEVEGWNSLGSNGAVEFRVEDADGNVLVSGSAEESVAGAAC